MPKPPVSSFIRLRGVQHNNLKNFDLDLPLNQFVVVTGLSGSGKSSLAFDTLFAEGQRRYIETFSPYARQFFDRMDKPRVDSIEGIPPAIAIEQRNSVRSTRSTVGTMTEICDYMKLLWPHVARLHCRNCGRPVRKDSPQSIWQSLIATVANGASTDCLITFDLPLTDKLPLKECVSLVAKQGYQRLLIHSAVPRQARSGIPPGAASRFPASDQTPVAAEVPSTGSSTNTLVAELPAAPTHVQLELNEAAAPWGAPAEAGFDGEIVRIEDVAARLRTDHPKILTIVQDRIRLSPANRTRFTEACEQAYHFGKGRITIHVSTGATGKSEGSSRIPRRFSNRLHCAECDIEYRDPSPALFSFNHPVGACAKCRGFGRVIGIDYNLAIPDRSKPLAGGVIKPWQSGVSAECQRDLMKFCKIRKVPIDVPFEELSPKWQTWVIDGDPGYGQDKEHEWPRAWYGVKGYFRWLESKSYKMHMRVLLSRYRSYTRCPDCDGKRFQPESLLYRIPRHADAAPAPLPVGSGTTLADFYQLPIRDALSFIEQLAGKPAKSAPEVNLQETTELFHPAVGGHRSVDARAQLGKKSDPIALALAEVQSRLSYLVDVGLGYLTLDRPTRSLSGGETERVNLTTCIGTRLVNTLYVLDEPSVGLHPRDTGRLIRVLHELRNLGNTVVVVEHEASVIRAADQIVDLGPGHGASGGRLVFQGSFRELLKCRESLTGQFLSGRKRVDHRARRPIAGATGDLEGNAPSFRRSSSWLTVHGANVHNLHNLTVPIPLGRFVCVTGVSGSGKSTLIRDVLLPALETRLKAPDGAVPERLNETDEEVADESRQGAHVTGAEALGRVVLVDQTAIGKTPRSNPAVYVGAFDHIRELFAESEVAKQRGLNSSAFSFNSAQGQCGRCRGAGFEKIEMQFLSDVFIRCQDCDGRRYRPHILEVRISATDNRSETRNQKSKIKNQKTTLSIADVLDSTVDEAITFLEGFQHSRHAKRALTGLRFLQEVGLGYLRLGQPINTLSGGESQRLKLAGHVAISAGNTSLPSRLDPRPGSQQSQIENSKPILFLFDEPTTGLHFDDVRILLDALQRLVDAGHSVLVIEHNLDVVQCADWIIDLGPEAGNGGGRLVACGTPEDIAACESSHTGKFLGALLH
jgi:excinuclease ABC subunit A